MFVLNCLSGGPPQTGGCIEQKSPLVLTEGFQNKPKKLLNKLLKTKSKGEEEKIVK